VVNHVHLWDLFAPEDTEGAEDSSTLEEAFLASMLEVLAKTWITSANDQFPDRTFEVGCSNDDSDYGPTITIWCVSPAEAFRSGSFFNEFVYAHFAAYCVEIQNSTLIRWFEDDVDCIVVDLIRQDSEVLRFYSATNSSQQESPKNITDIFMDTVRRNRQKPWNVEVIAWNSFNENSDVSSP